MENESKRREPRGELFSAAQLVWRDEESGEILEIEMVGAVPWGLELEETGFHPAAALAPDPSRRRCRIELAPPGG